MTSENITRADSRPLGSSFRDPNGFLFTRDGVLYRQINQGYAENYTHLMESGLYEDLVDAGLLIPHQEVDVPAADPRAAWKVIRPEPVELISYPYEWSFSQLRAAALATISIQQRAMAYDLSLKDSSAYNIQLHNGRSTLIDTLSFEKYPEGKPWVAYRQFCQHFLAPLSLMALRDVRLQQLLRVYIDGIPLDLASKLLPARTRLSMPLLMHIHLHAASQQRFAGTAVKSERQISRMAFLGLIHSLETAVERLSWSPVGTEWSGYYADCQYSTEAAAHKQRLVGKFLDMAAPLIQPKTVWDLGANTGRYSRLASERGLFTAAFDIDPGAVERNFREVVEKEETHLLPLVLDLTNPSPALGWGGRERLSLMERGPAGAVLALALIHHLAISNNVPLERAALFFRQLSRWLAIELVPKSDPQVQRLLASREDIFPDYHPEAFEAVFQRYFKIRRKEIVEGTERVLYFMEAAD